MLKSSSDYNWAWSQADSPDLAEEIFQQTYPSVFKHLKAYESRLINRADQGIYWWELRHCNYYQSFKDPKIIYQVIQTLPQYAFDESGAYGNDKTFIISQANLCLLGYQ